MTWPPALAPLPPEGAPDRDRLGSVRAYALAVGIAVAAIYSQYFVPVLLPATAGIYGSVVGGLGIVYGVPIAAFAVLVGGRPLARWRAHGAVAAWEGIRWYGLMVLLGAFVSAALIDLYLRFDPGALQLLSRPNPVLTAARDDPWFWIAFSFAIGAIEETIFRGWIFGYWLTRGSSRWAVHAAWTSALFAAVHLYYGTTYGAAAPLIYPTLFLMGFSFAATYRASGGNLWVVALLHGAHDSAAFLTILSPGAALGVELGLIGVGLLVALIDFVASSRVPGPVGPPYGWPPPGAPVGPYFPPPPGPPPADALAPPLPPPPPPGPPPSSFGSPPPPP